MNFHPPGWRAGQIERRFASGAPSSYDAETHSVNCIISVGSPVQRIFGVERLRISPDAVDLSRMSLSGIPLLDSHQQHGIENALGRFTRAWFESRSGQPALMGQIVFNDTERGRVAEGMVKRGEIAGISAGYTVHEWEISDKDGRVLDPEVTRINFDDELTFEATRWSLLEGSLVTVPADSAAMIRSMGGSHDQQIVADVQARMLARRRISLRQAMYDDQAALDD